MIYRQMNSTMALLSISLGLILITSCVKSCDSEKTSKTKLTTREFALGKLDASVKHIFVSKNNKHLAYARDIGDEILVVLDGIEGKKYSKVSSPVFSPDGERVAYAAEHYNHRWVVVADGVEGEEYDFIATETLIFSPDSKHLAYGAGYETPYGRKQFIVLDRMEQKEYDTAKNEDLLCVGFVKCVRFSPNSRRIAYAARRKSKSFFVVNGLEEKGYDSIVGRDPLFSPDSKHVAYVAKDNSEYFIVVDGVEGQRYHWDPGNIVFSADSNHIAYIVEMVPVIDGVERKEHTVSDIYVYFSPNSQHIAYRASSNGGGSCVVFDGKKLKEKYDIIGTPIIFSPDSNHIVYVANREKKWFAVIDGVEGKKYDRVEWIYDTKSSVFSPDSAHTAFWLKHGNKEFVVLDGVEQNKYDEIILGELMLGAHVFSPDSKHVAYTAKRGGKQFIVVDGVEGKEYDKVRWQSVVFSPDSKHVAYIGEREGKQFIVVDGMETKGYDSYLEEGALTLKDHNFTVEYYDHYLLVFVSRNLLYGVARIDKEIVRTEIEVLDK